MLLLGQLGDVHAHVDILNSCRMCVGQGHFGPVQLCSCRDHQSQRAGVHLHSHIPNVLYIPDVLCERRWRPAAVEMHVREGIAMPLRLQLAPAVGACGIVRAPAALSYCAFVCMPWPPAYAHAAVALAYVRHPRLP